MFRRRRRAEETTLDQPVLEEVGADAPDPAGAPAGGPFDAADVDLDEARKSRIDLGGLLVPAVSGTQLQLQVDERSGKGASVTVVSGDAAAQMIAVAAPRKSGLWGQTRLQMVADATRRGGTTEEVEGLLGTEVRAVLPVKLADGKNAVQPSRVVGVDGPRWMLRVTFLGKAASDQEAYERLVAVVRNTVVVRGESPMAPGDVIVLTPPQRPEDADDDDQSKGSSA